MYICYVTYVRKYVCCKLYRSEYNFSQFPPFFLSFVTPRALLVIKNTFWIYQPEQYKSWNIRKLNLFYVTSLHVQYKRTLYYLCNRFFMRWDVILIKQNWNCIHNNECASSWILGLAGGLAGCLHHQPVHPAWH